MCVFFIIIVGFFFLILWWHIFVLYLKDLNVLWSKKLHQIFSWEMLLMYLRSDVAVIQKKQTFKKKCDRLVFGGAFFWVFFFLLLENKCRSAKQSAAECLYSGSTKTRRRSVQQFCGGNTATHEPCDLWGELPRPPPSASVRTLPLIQQPQIICRLVFKRTVHPKS